MNTYKNELSDSQGFTLIELIIVIALIAIIGAMLIPSFSETTKRAKIKTDINSLRVIQNAIDLYEIETNKKLDSLDTLSNTGYLPNKPLTQYENATYNILKSDEKKTLAVYDYKDDGFIEKYIKNLDMIEIKDNLLYLK